MTLHEIESITNQVLTASPVFVHCVCMHEYSVARVGRPRLPGQRDGTSPSPTMSWLARSRPTLFPGGFVLRSKVEHPLIQASA